MKQYECRALFLKLPGPLYQIHMGQKQGPAAILFQAKLVQNGLWLPAFFDFFLIFLPEMANRLTAGETANWDYHTK